MGLITLGVSGEGNYLDRNKVPWFVRIDKTLNFLARYPLDVILTSCHPFFSKRLQVCLF